MLVFPEKWSALADQMKTDIPILLKGGYARRDQDADNPAFVVESVTKLAELRANGQVMISIELKKDPSRTTIGDQAKCGRSWSHIPEPCRLR